MNTLCEVCKESHYIPVGNICLRCVQKQKHRQDVEEFIEKNVPKEIEPKKETLWPELENKEEEVSINDF